VRYQDGFSDLVEHARNNHAVDQRVACTIVVPCYNEHDGVGGVIESLLTYCKEIGAYEIIVVDDGSSDGSADVLAQYTRRYPHVRVITHQHNRGYGAALKTGILHAAAELVVITDADGTYPNKCIPALLELAQTSDMVVGARAMGSIVYPLNRKIAKFFLRQYASWLVGRPIPDINSGLRVLRRSVVEKFLNILPDGFSFTTTITLAMLTNHYEVRYVPIGYARRVGRSKIRPIKDTLNFLQLILRTGMYFAPMRVFLPVAMLLSLFFIISLTYDLFVLRDLTDTTLVFLLFTMNTGMFALLADMIDKRSHK
jgi:glycosyltransferase involved in cell wall biosynthesis